MRAGAGASRTTSTARSCRASSGSRLWS
jgi:hypothetical protein